MGIGMKNEQQLYLMKNDFGLYKIGISLNPNKRRLDIQNNSGVGTQIVKTWDTKRLAFDVEQALHRELDKFRKHGEWFDYDEQKILKLCDKFSKKRVLTQTNPVNVIKSKKLPVEKLTTSTGFKNLLTFNENARETVIRNSALAIVKLGLDFNFTKDVWFSTLKDVVAHTQAIRIEKIRCLYDEVYDAFVKQESNPMKADIILLLTEDLMDNFWLSDFKNGYKYCLGKDLNEHRGIRLNVKYKQHSDTVHYFKFCRQVFKKGVDNVDFQRDIMRYGWITCYDRSVAAKFDKFLGTNLSDQIIAIELNG